MLVDVMLHDPYREPRLYDLEYATQIEDVQHYRTLASRYGGPILELGCGNGRITVPIAKSGLRIHGIDSSAAMLADLELKRASKTLPTLSFEQGNFCDFTAKEKFRLIILPFNAVHHCHSHRDLLGLLSCVREALVPSGLFALDCYLPDPDLYQRDPNKRYEEQVLVDPRTNRPLETWEQGHYDTWNQIHHVHYVYRQADGTEERAHLALRMYYPQEMLAMLDWAGFEIVHQASDFAGRAMHATALKWILHLRPTAGKT